MLISKMRPEKKVMLTVPVKLKSVHNWSRQVIHIQVLLFSIYVNTTLER